MSWTTNLFLIVCFTTMTGGVLTVVWRLLGILLERIGFLNISYQLMQTIMLFWFVPLVYTTLWILDSHMPRWGGDLLLGTPMIYHVGQVFACVWIAGVGLNLIRYAVEAVKVTTLRERAVCCDRCVNQQLEQVIKKLNAKETVIVRKSYQVHVPQVTGIIKPMVILPMCDYNDEELKLIFAHEITHVKHRDILMKNLGMLIRALHFMNPIAWWYCRLSDQWAEYACDYEVCRKYRCFKHYYTVLLDMAQELNANAVVVSRIMEGKHQLLERMEHVSKSYNRNKISRAMTAVLLSAIVAVSGSTVCFASVESADVLDYVNQETAVETEVVNDQQYLQETVETETAHDVVEVEGETELMTAGATGASFSWTVSKKTLVKTTAFSASSGKTISIGVQNPSGASIRVGIILPNGNKKYVTSSGYSISHDFSVSTTGSYRVFVQNMSGSTISVSGNYYVI